ncbi:MAG: YebC/PmpR family DNA-binding transcriptional regulator [Oscillospiraceae bacterium]|nr:YebC/PmpR family DNA-binding transcriptional regulator [Oscillospiraceae bacterium]
MSGHSKWNNIKRKKEKTDAQRAKIFTKIGRQISVAVKEAGADPAVNNKLKELILKAKSNNVPNDNISRIIKKAAGEGGKNDYEEIIYEGYGPSGVDIIVETLTNNRNRTAGDLRHYFDKFGGNLGQTGCVSFLFESKGVIEILLDDLINKDKLLEDSLALDIEDIEILDDIAIVYTEPKNLSEITSSLEKLNYKINSSEINKIPNTYVNISDPDVLLKLERLLDMLEDNDDVQNVWNNLFEE